MKAYKTELDPNNVQATMLRQHCGAGRWAYNWGLERLKQAIESGTKWPSAIDLHKELNALKGTDALPWAYEVSKCAFQESLRNLETAVKNWRASKKGERKGATMGFPKRKTKKCGLGSCRFTGIIKVLDGRVQLPRIGLVRLKEHGYIPTGKYAQATITERAGHWFVSVAAKFEPETRPQAGALWARLTAPIGGTLVGAIIGIDVGIKTLATCSDGDTYANPTALNAKTKQLRRWQRRLSRRKKGGKNRAKARIKVARLHKKVADIRQDAHNKAARAIVNKRPAIIVIEDLNVNGMFKNRKLARALSDAAFGNFGRTLGYMAADAGIEVRKAGRFFASSKTCACCGWKKEDLTLSDRIFICDDCGHTMDRDLNAAINLKNTVSSTGIYAYGDRVSPGLAQAVIGEIGILSQMSTARLSSPKSSGTFV
jgi:putative transposase